MCLTYLLRMTFFHPSITNALDFAAVRSEEDRVLLREAKKAAKGTKMSPEQVPFFSFNLRNPFRWQRPHGSKGNLSLPIPDLGFLLSHSMQL